jgi:hypothetical protein
MGLRLSLLLSLLMDHFVRDNTCHSVMFGHAVLSISFSHLSYVSLKSTPRSGNACCHSVQNLLSSNLLSKNTKIKIYRSIIFPVVLYGCETWSLTLREELRMRVLENKMLRRIFGPKRDEVIG